MNEILELKESIRTYLIIGNNLKPWLGEKQLKDLKQQLKDLKEKLGDKWEKEIGRSFDCFNIEINFKLLEYKNGTHINQNQPKPVIGIGDQREIITQRDNIVLENPNTSETTRGEQSRTVKEAKQNQQGQDRPIEVLKPEPTPPTKTPEQLAEEERERVAQEKLRLERELEQERIRKEQEAEQERIRKEQERLRKIDEAWEAFIKGKGTNKQDWINTNLTSQEAQVAWNNNWTEPTIIKNKQINYQGEVLNPLIYDKKQLDQANQLINEINGLNTFADLPVDYKQDIRNALNDAKIPAGKHQQDITNLIITRRATFSLSLDEPKDGGLSPELLAKAREMQEDIYIAKAKPPAPADIINQVLRWEITKDRKPVEKLEWSEPIDLDPWLTNDTNKGYRIEDEPAQIIRGKAWTGKEILEQEYNKWGNKQSPEYDPSKQGSLLLPFFNQKVGFDIDNPDLFLCEPGNLIKGHLPYATGIGKTTKIMCCICLGGGRMVILTLPTEELALSAYNAHSSDWMQYFFCVIHLDRHGKYPVWLFEVGEGEGLSILRPGDLLGYLIRNLLNFTKSKEGVIGIKGLGRPATNTADFDAKVEEIRQGRKLKKEKHFIVYDEADEANPTYQTIIEEAINQGYKCIKASATFEGVPWSITTTNPIKSQLITGLRDEMLIAKDGEPKNLLIFIRETEPRTKGKNIIEALTPEQKQLLEPYSYVVFDKSNAAVAEGISRGMTRGTIFFVSPKFGRGFTFYVQATIITNWMQTKKLGAGWIYDEPNTQRLPLSDQGQERGRVGRTEEGDAWWLNNEIGSLKGGQDIGTILTRAVLTGDLTELSKSYNILTREGIDFIRSAIAWPDKFGLLPEEILIGVQVGGAGGKKYPIFPEKPPTTYDPDLWDRHRKIVKKSSMPKDTATNILKLMIANLIKRKTKDNQFPNNINVKIESPLIEQIGWSEDRKKNANNIKEIRQVVNGVIKENIPDPTINKYKDEELFKKVVNLHKISLDLKVNIVREDTDEWIDKKKQELGKKKKDNLTILIASAA